MSNRKELYATRRLLEFFKDTISLGVAEVAFRLSADTTLKNARPELRSTIAAQLTSALSLRELRRILK